MHPRPNWPHHKCTRFRIGCVASASDTESAASQVRPCPNSPRRKCIRVRIGRVGSTTVSESGAAKSCIAASDLDVPAASSRGVNWILVEWIKNKFSPGNHNFHIRQKQCIRMKDATDIWLMVWLEFYISALQIPPSDSYLTKKCLLKWRLEIKS